MTLVGKINALGVVTKGQDGKEYVGKGTYSVSGLGRFPVTLYPNQWRELLSVSQHILAEIDAGLKAGTLAGEKATTTPTGNRTALVAAYSPTKK